MRTHVVAIGGARGLLDHEAEDDEATVAVAAALPRREVRGLEREVSQMVRRLDLGVVRLLDEQVLVPLPCLFVRIVGDARGMGQQVAHRDRGRDGRALEAEVVDCRRVEVEGALGHELQRGDRGERLRDRRAVEPQIRRHRHAPSAARPPVGTFEHRDCAASEHDDARQLVVGREGAKVSIEVVERVAHVSSSAISFFGAIAR